jgi:hypothetical protein
MLSQYTKVAPIAIGENYFRPGHLFERGLLPNEIRKLIKLSKDPTETTPLLVFKIKNN